jgi:sortase A
LRFQITLHFHREVIIRAVTIRRHAILRHLERLSIIVGVVGIFLTAVIMLDRYIGLDLSILAFEEAVAAEMQVGQVAVIAADKDLIDSSTDQSTPVAILSISRLNLEVPVFSELNQRSLNRGAAIVTGSPEPFEPGNISVAAHRDSFFRPLKDVNVGDVVLLQTAKTNREYRVVEIFITDPLDVSVLESIDEQSVLTLITCYPFNYIGFAPDRFIVRAEALSVAAPISST